MRRLSGSGACLDVAADDEAESVTRTSKDQRDEELQVFWSYISNMLINFESLPLERIYTMLKMFAMPTSDSSSTAGHSGSGECDIEVRVLLSHIALSVSELCKIFISFTGGPCLSRQEGSRPRARV